MPNDVLLNEGFDINYNADSEIVRGESTVQHQTLLIICAKGEFKESPTACVGAYNYLKENDTKGLLPETKKELQRDGMDVQQLKIENGNILVTAPYI